MPKEFERVLLLVLPLICKEVLLYIHRQDKVDKVKRPKNLYAFLASAFKIVKFALEKALIVRGLMP